MRNNKTTKGNKRPIKKLIALWVVFAMLVVPFASYVGEKEGARAASDVQVISDAQTYTQMVNLTITAENGSPAIQNGHVDITLLKSAQKFQFKYESLTDTTNITPLTIGYIEYSSLDDPAEELDDSTSCTVINVNDIIPISDTTSDKTIAIYAYNDGTSKRLQYVIKVNRVDAFTTNGGIYPAEDSTDPFYDGTYTASAYLKAGSTDVASVATASLKYYVGTTDLTTDDQKKAVATYDKTSNTFSKDDASLCNQTVFAYAAVISDNNTPADSNDDIVLAYEKLGSVHISNDTTAPNVTGEIQIWNGSSYESLTETEKTAHISGGIYYGVSEKYRYAITVADTPASGQELSGIKSVSIQIGEETPVSLTRNGDGNYYHEMTAEQVATANGASVKIIAADNMGNGANTPVLLDSIKQVATATTVSRVTLVEDPLWDGMTQEKKIPYQTAKKTLEVTVSTTDTISDIKLVDSVSADLLKTGDLVQGTVEEDTRTHTVTAKFMIPDDLETSQKYSGMKVYIKRNGDTDFSVITETTIKDILYDAKAPVISAPVLQESEDGSSWSDVSGADDIVTELGHQYRYKVTVTDFETIDSGVEKVYLDDSDSSTNFTNSSGAEWVLNIDVESLSATDFYKPTVYAKDLAGNITTNGVQLRGIKKIDASLSITNLVIKDESGTNVTSTFASGTTKYTTEQHTLSVDVASAYDIAEVKLYSEEYPSGQGPATAFSSSYDSTTHRYSATVTFKLPTGTDINAVLNKMYIQAWDAKTPTANVVRYPSTEGTFIGNILYDLTQPTLDLSRTIDDTVWYKNFSVGYTIKSGAATDESPLKNGTVKYALSDCKNNVADGQIAVDGTQTSVTSAQEMAIPQSTSIYGTLLSFEAQDVCENRLPAEGSSYRIKVDGEEPKITLFDVNKKTILPNALEGDVTIRANVSDNLTIASATIRVVGPDGIDVTKSLCDAGERVGIGKDNSFTLDALLGKKAPDGNYTVTVKVSDKAGNSASDRTISFTVDNTIPVVTAKIAGGTTAGKQPGTNFDGTVCDYFYRSNVPVVLTYEDDNLAASGVTVTDNGNKLKLNWERLGGSNKYQATYTATQEGPHTVKITAKDDAGNDAVAKQVVFIKDITAPTITAVLNGGIVYSEGMGEVDLTSAASLNLSVNDKNEDAQDFHYQLVKTAPDTLPVTADYISTNNRTFAFADEADYLVNAYAIDKAGNKGLIKSVLFRVDTTAPEIKISGAASGSSLNAGTTLTFTMTEAFWKDASGTVTITRKAGDGASESTYKTIDYKPTARTTNISESLTETGEYKVTFTAKDRAGHTSEAATYTVKIDKDKPVITLNGVANNDKTTGEVEFLAQIEDDFYLTKAISIKATRTYLDETTYQEKTEDIKFTGYNAAASDTIIRDTFKEDGFYKIQITCKDAAGNEDTQEVSFTIDKSKPFIDSKVLGAYEGTLTAFAWDYDISDLVYDLTVCDVHMYLNGSEYDGTSEIEDGAYEMKITAEDELGNYVEQIVNFTLDTKAPTFIVTGVEDGEVKNEQYTIEVSLQLDEDVLDSVSLNGSAVEVKDNKASLTVSDKGDYELTMKAHDAAGNEAEKTIRFTYGEKSTWWLYLIIGVAAVLAIGGVIFVVVRKKNN